MSNLAQVLKKALNLSVHDRAAIAERLLASLDELTEDEAKRLWADEALRRLSDVREGRARAIPAGTVHRKARKLLK